MPTSRPYPLVHFSNTIIDLQPNKILDIGIGGGKYGFLVREYTDTWHGRYQDDANNRVHIHGIEVFPEYIGKLQRAIYDRIFIGNVLDVLPDLSNAYDLLIMADVIEHFEKKDAEKLLKLIKSKSKKSIITTPHPMAYKKQGSTYGNDHERHLHCWSITDLKKHGKVFNFENKICMLMIGF